MNCRSRRARRWTVATATRRALGAALLLALSAGAYAAPRDDVVMKDKARNRLNITVLDETFEKVVMDTNGDGKEDASEPIEQVEKIRYGDRPQVYILAESAFNSRRYDKAAELFEKALADPNVRRFWIEQYAGYQLGLCRAEMGRQDAKNYDTAIGHFRTMLAKQPKAHMAPLCKRGLARCYAAKNDSAAAEKELLEVAGGQYGQEQAFNAKLDLARLYIALKRPADAIRLCEEARQVAGKLEAQGLQLEANFAVAEILTAAERGQEAYEMLKQLADQHGEQETEVRARIYNAIGDCLLQQNRVSEALLAYLRVRVLYFKLPEETARSLYGAARSFRALGQAERARESVKELLDSYGDSKWADLARAEFPEVK